AAWSLSLLPGARWWLPLAAGVTPGVVAATALTLGDSLALGLTVAAFAAAARRRPHPLLVALVARVLTRETVILAALALALTPKLSTAWRVAYVVVPGALIGAWILWVSHVLGIPANDGASDQLSFPLTGWVHSTGGLEVVIALLLVMVLLL